MAAGLLPHAGDVGGVATEGGMVNTHGTSLGCGGGGGAASPRGGGGGRGASRPCGTGGEGGRAVDGSVQRTDAKKGGGVGGEGGGKGGFVQNAASRRGTVGTVGEVRGGGGGSVQHTTGSKRGTGATNTPDLVYHFCQQCML